MTLSERDYMRRESEGGASEGAPSPSRPERLLHGCLSALGLAVCLATLLVVLALLIGLGLVGWVGILVIAAVVRWAL